MQSRRVIFPSPYEPFDAVEEDVYTPTKLFFTPNASVDLSKPLSKHPEHAEPNDESYFLRHKEKLAEDGDKSSLHSSRSSLDSRDMSSNLPCEASADLDQCTANVSRLREICEHIVPLWPPVESTTSVTISSAPETVACVPILMTDSKTLMELQVPPASLTKLLRLHYLKQERLALSTWKSCLEFGVSLEKQVSCISSSRDALVAELSDVRSFVDEVNALLHGSHIRPAHADLSATAPAAGTAGAVSSELPPAMRGSQTSLRSLSTLSTVSDASAALGSTGASGAGGSAESASNTARLVVSLVARRHRFEAHDRRPTDRSASATPAPAINYDLLDDPNALSLIERASRTRDASCLVPVFRAVALTQLLGLYSLVEDLSSSIQTYQYLLRRIDELPATAFANPFSKSSPYTLAVPQTELVRGAPRTRFDEYREKISLLLRTAVEALDSLVARGARLLTYAHLETLDDETLWQVCRGLEHASGVRERYRDVLLSSSPSAGSSSSSGARAPQRTSPAFEAILRQLARERATRLAAVVYRAVGSNADLVRYLRERLEKLDLRAVDWYAVLAIHTSKLESSAQPAPLSANKYFEHAARHLSSAFRDKFARWEAAAAKQRKQQKQQQKQKQQHAALKNAASADAEKRNSPSSDKASLSSTAATSNEFDESRAVALLELLSGDPQLGVRLRLVSDSLDFPVAQLVEEEHTFVSRLLDIASHATNLLQSSASATAAASASALSGALSRSHTTTHSLARKSAMLSSAEHFEVAANAAAQRTASTRASFGGRSALNKSVKWSDESQLEGAKARLRAVYETSFWREFGQQLVARSDAPVSRLAPAVTRYSLGPPALLGAAGALFFAHLFHALVAQRSLPAPAVPHAHALCFHLEARAVTQLWHSCVMHAQNSERRDRLQTQAPSSRAQLSLALPGAAFASPFALHLHDAVAPALATAARVLIDVCLSPTSFSNVIMLVADIENLSNMVLESLRRALLPWRRSQILRNLLTWNVKNIFADLLSHHLLAVVPLELFVAAIQSVRQKLAVAERHARPLPPAPSMTAAASKANLQNPQSPQNHLQSTDAVGDSRPRGAAAAGGGSSGAPLVALLAELNARLVGVEREAVLLVHECLAVRTDGMRELRTRWRTRVGELLLEQFPNEANQNARYWRQDPPPAAKNKKSGSKDGGAESASASASASVSAPASPQPEPSEYMKALASEQLVPLFTALFTHYIRESASDNVNPDDADSSAISAPNALLWQLVQTLVDELCAALMGLVLSQRIRFSLYGAILLQNDVLFLFDSIASLLPTVGGLPNAKPNAPNPDTRSTQFAERVREFAGVRQLFECLAILLHQHVSDNDKSRRRPPLPPGASSRGSRATAGGLCSCAPVVEDALIERAVSSNPYASTSSREPLPPPSGPNGRGSARSRLSRTGSLESLASIELPQSAQRVEQRSRSRSRSRTASNATPLASESQRNYIESNARSPRSEQQQVVDVAAWKRLRARSPSPGTRAFFSFLLCN